MKSKTLRIIGILVALLTIPATSIADVYSFQLHDHPDGAAALPTYGLRLDGLLDGVESTTTTFSFDATDAYMVLTYDTVTDILKISGLARGGPEAGLTDHNSSDLWKIDFTYTGIIGPDAAFGGGDNTIDLRAYNVAPDTIGSGTGTIARVSGGPAISFDLVDYNSKTDAETFKFASDGHRLDGDSTSLVGEGWLNHSGTDINNHFVASDWLFTASVIPEPGVIAGLGIAVLGLGYRRFRSRKNATAEA